MTDTIFALSSGAPPAAIAVMRVSGPRAADALAALAGAPSPMPRHATLRRLCDAQGEALDHALVLWFPGPATATGDDLAELHLHGGRAVVRAVEAALAALPGLRAADPGEFTRRAFANGRIDLTEAEGLADLLSAETELQRRQAMGLASGALSRQAIEWRDAILTASAGVEAMLDFGDEDEVAEQGFDVAAVLGALADELAVMLDQPRVESLREGFRVVLAGPPNSGKSSLFNKLLDEDAAIATPIAGTTRDVLIRPVAIAGIPFVFVDTAGLRDKTQDSIEAIGMERARIELQRADLVLWLGPEGEAGDARIWEIESFADTSPNPKKRAARHRISSMSEEGVAALRDDLIGLARSTLPALGTTALNRRQHALLSEARRALEDGMYATDLLIVAESLRLARAAFDRLLGHSATEDMLDALFGRFCIGK